MIKAIYSYTYDSNDNKLVSMVCFIVNDNNICVLEPKDCMITTKRFDVIMGKFMLDQNLDFKSSNDEAHVKLWNYLVDVFGFNPIGNLPKGEYILHKQGKDNISESVRKYITTESSQFDEMRGKGWDEQALFLKIFDSNRPSKDIKEEKDTEETFKTLSVKYKEVVQNTIPNAQPLLKNDIDNSKWKETYDKMMLNKQKEDYEKWWNSLTIFQKTKVLFLRFCKKFKCKK
jgi:hypothetical protein